MSLKFDPGIFCRFFLRLTLITMALLTLNGAQAYSFTDNGDGTVTDSATGLMWKRCRQGQTWTGSTCSGDTPRYTYDQASALIGTVGSSFAGYSDWRIPNIRELQTIVNRYAHKPAVDRTAFPNAPSVDVMSTSTNANKFGYVWGVSYGHGGSYNTYPLSYLKEVWMVRGGQYPNNLMGISRPTSDYVSGNGTVTHTPTNLMWKRCSEGQTWTGSTCNGTATRINVDQMATLSTNFEGFTDWRIPTVDELLSLVDYSTIGKMINDNIFPNTPNTYYWSNTPEALNSSTDVWYVNFNSGAGYGAYFDNRNSTYNAVRMVRTNYDPPISCSSNSQFMMQKVYRGYYNRCGERSGVEYWCKRLDNTGGKVDETLISAFGTSEEFIKGFIGFNDQQLITNLYQFMFNRNPESDGLAFYVGLLAQRRTEWLNGHSNDTYGATMYALARIALDILNGTRGSDVDTLNGKAASCRVF